MWYFGRGYLLAFPCARTHAMRVVRFTCALLLGVVACTPTFAADHSTLAALSAVDSVRTNNLPVPSPEAALQLFVERAERQKIALSEYSDTTVIRADLVDTAQSGEYELERRYVAPKTLQFKPVRFTGDNFVKTNVIVRVLQSEAEHVAKDDNAESALTQENYKFKHKYTQTDAAGRPVYVYEVKPRHKRPGLFKGHIWIDGPTGTLTRAEGTLAKSPSFFLKKVDFVQEYANVNGFTLPVHLHSVAKVRIIGRTVVDVFHRDYHPAAAAGADGVTAGLR